MTEKFTLDNDLLEEAKSIATKIKDTKLRKRAYALNIAANAVAKYLGIRTSHSLYKIPSFSQYFELADLYINGVRLDVRVSFNGKSFSIPKIQKKYEAEPHAYIVLHLEKDLSSANILGFVPTGKLGEGKADEEYYLYSTNILSPISELKDFTSKIELNQKVFSTNDHEKIKELAASFVDDEISESERVYFIKHVIACPVCRETFCDLNGFDLTAIQVKNYHELLNDSTLSVLSGNMTEVAEATLANLATVENAEENFENETQAELVENTQEILEQEEESETLETVDTIEQNDELLELNEDVELLEILDESEQLETTDAQEEIVRPMSIAQVETDEEKIVETLETLDTIENTEEIITENDLPELMESEELLEILEESDSLITNEEIKSNNEPLTEALEEEPLETLDTLETIEEETPLIEDESSFDKIEEVTETTELLETVEEDALSVTEEDDNELLIGDEELTPLDEMQNIENAEEVIQEALEESLEEIIDEKEETIEKEIKEELEEPLPIAEIKEEEQIKVEPTVEMIAEENNTENTIEDNSFEEASLDELAALSDISDDDDIQENTESEEINQLLDDDLRAMLTEDTTSENNNQEVATNVTTQTSDTELNALYETKEHETNTNSTEEFVLPQEPIAEKTVNNAKKGLTVFACLIVLACAGAAAWFVNNQKNSANDIAMENANQDEMYNMQNPNIEEQPPAISQDINKSMTNSFSDKPTAITITKLSWQISEKLALENSVKEYLQTAGKNIQMNLQNDLANSADINFNNSIKVSFEIAQDNTLKGLQILESSGSDQIDDIVARSIKNTLKYVSVPKIESHKSDYFLTLIINF